MNHNLAKRHPKGAFSFLENAHSVRFSCAFAHSQRKQKRLENREMVLQPGPVRTTIPGHNHYVQYNKKVKKVKRFAN